MLLRVLHTMSTMSDSTNPKRCSYVGCYDNAAEGSDICQLCHHTDKITKQYTPLIEAANASGNSREAIRLLNKMNLELESAHKWFTGEVWEK